MGTITSNKEISSKALQLVEKLIMPRFLKLPVEENSVGSVVIIGTQPSSRANWIFGLVKSMHKVLPDKNITVEKTPLEIRRRFLTISYPERVEGIEVCSVFLVK